ncbi:MAG: hypothetical protein CMI74_05755 [Candidatus Pelagibacter sp.]|nr:hypothetical protein [Candidatus Pelagibacter sp.]|tara:strand:- start:1667 stop:2968 length:1302 start_codon:yes stop_codon:yes gene_type:complete
MAIMKDFVNAGGAFSAGMSAGLSGIDNQIRRADQAQAAVDSRAMSLINQYPPDPEFDKVSDEAREPLLNFVNQNKQNYFNIARQLSTMRPTDDNFMNMSSQLQSLKAGMITANDYLNDFKSLKEEYFQERNNMSNGMSPEDKRKLDLVFLENNYSMQFDDFGTPTYKTELGDINHAQLSNYYTKDDAFALEVMNKANEVYTSGAQGINLKNTPSFNLLKNSLTMAINQGGPERLQSLLKDDLLEGYNLANINPDNYNNEEQMKNDIVNNIMGHLVNVNKSGLDQHKKVTKPSTPQFGQSMRDDLNTTRGIASNAYEFSKLAGEKNPNKIDQMVSLLRQSDIDNVDKIMSKQEMYDAWLASEDKNDKKSAQDDFNAIYGNSPIYYDSAALPFDINDPMGLFKLYLQLSPISDDVRNYYIQNYREPEKPKLPGVK